MQLPESHRSAALAHKHEPLDRDAAMSEAGRLQLRLLLAHVETRAERHRDQALAIINDMGPIREASVQLSTATRLGIIAGRVRAHIEEPNVGSTVSDTQIEIIQDHEVDDDEVLGLVASWWTRGHGHNRDDFMRAVVDEALETTGDVPGIPHDASVREVWQRSFPVGDIVSWDRSAQVDGMSDEWYPVTVLDLERRRGGPCCQVQGCSEPWSSGVPVRALVGGAVRVTVQIRLCREHGDRFPGPSYRVCMIPAGAKVVLPGGAG